MWGYNPRPADLDMWINKKVDTDNDSYYYYYILCYVDDIIVTHHDGMNILNNIGKYFKLKPDLIVDPNMYLGSKLRCHGNNNGVYTW